MKSFTVFLEGMVSLSKPTFLNVVSNDDFFKLLNVEDNEKMQVLIKNYIQI